MIAVSTWAHRASAPCSRSCSSTRTRSSRRTGSRTTCGRAVFPGPPQRRSRSTSPTFARHSGQRETRSRHTAPGTSCACGRASSTSTSSSGSWNEPRERSPRSARRHFARLCRSGEESRWLTSRTSSSCRRSRPASRSCAAWRWRSGSRPISRSGEDRSSSPSSRRSSPSGRWTSTHAHSSCSPCTEPDGRPTLSPSSAKAGVCSTKSWGSSSESSCVSSSARSFARTPHSR